MRKKPPKYPTEVIQSAITKYENGARLTTIAKEFKVNKSTVKYWLDNAAKFINNPDDKDPITSRMGSRLSRESWEIIFAALKQLKIKLPEMEGKDLVFTIGRLLDLQTIFSNMTGRIKVPESVIEKSEEIKLTVQKYLEKKTIELGKNSSKQDIQDVSNSSIEVQKLIEGGENDSK